MLTAGALITLVFGMAHLIDGCSDLSNARPFKASMLAAAIMLASFAGFYTAIVMVR